jgi:hypothetical protein
MLKIEKASPSRGGDGTLLMNDYETFIAKNGMRTQEPFGQFIPHREQAISIWLIFPSRSAF